ncbi:hypothetical protein I4U23_015188 [Adineta vaga]|nr:hypothetical protein I4U23_015188 [Adineta vaga]
MVLSFASSRPKKHLTKDQNSCIVLVVGICCFLGALFVYTGSQDIYKLRTLIIGRCQVRSLNVKHTRYNYFPCWNITVIYENETKEDYVIESTGTRSDRWAWIQARKYQVNNTYSCYHSRNETSIIQWGWQWSRPRKLKAYTLFILGCILISITIVLLIMRRRFQKYTKTISPERDTQQQLQTLLNSNQQTMKSQEESSSIVVKPVSSWQNTETNI